MDVPVFAHELLVCWGNIPLPLFTVTRWSAIIRSRLKLTALYRLRGSAIMAASINNRSLLAARLLFCAQKLVFLMHHNTWWQYKEENYFWNNGQRDFHFGHSHFLTASEEDKCIEHHYPELVRWCCAVCGYKWLSSMHFCTKGKALTINQLYLQLQLFFVRWCLCSVQEELEECMGHHQSIDGPILRLN